MTTHTVDCSSTSKEAVQQVLNEKEGYLVTSFEVSEGKVIFEFRESKARNNNYVWFVSETDEVEEHVVNYEEQGWSLVDYSVEEQVYLLFHKGGEKR